MAKVSSNPFNDFFKSFNSLNALNWSSFDVNQYNTFQKRNAEAANEALQAWAAGIQEISRLNAQILQENSKNLLNQLKEILTNGSSPEAAVAKQTELFRKLLEDSIANASESGEIAAKSTKEAFEVLNRRLAESVQEFSEILQSKK